MKNILQRLRNRSIAFAYDTSVIAVAWLLAFWIRFDCRAIPPSILHQALLALPIVLALQAGIFWRYGLYRGVWRFASIPDLTRIVKASVLGTLVILMLFFFLRTIVILPRVVPLLYLILLIGGVGSARAAFRWLKDYRNIFHDSQRVLIVGAGNAGEGLIRDLMRHAKHLYHPVGLVDDHPIKQQREIHGIPVIGTCDDIALAVQQHAIDLIMIAMPSASAVALRRIVQHCESANVPYRILPSLGDLAEGFVAVKQLREVALEDLLGRDPVTLDWPGLSAEFQSKTILVCGGGGSIGSELCRQIAHFNPMVLVVVDQNEFNLYTIDMELRKQFPYLTLICLLQDIVDKVGLNHIFSTHRPHIVFHAAAYKHVPLMEGQYRAGILNNIIGTRSLAEIAVQYSVKKFILISTDKAVNPTNMMGATKRAAEIFCQNLNEHSATDFITVRFGNVLNSAGSVIPLFRQQLQAGGPLTVTHPDITRFFMTIPEASQLIMQAAFMGFGGEIFVLNMGESIKIRYLAEQMIRLAGKVPGEDIDIVYTGLRPGEKLYEELFHEHELLRPTSHVKILLANARSVFWSQWLAQLDKLEGLCQMSFNDVSLQQHLCQLVPEYATVIDPLKVADIIPFVKKPLSGESH